MMDIIMMGLGAVITIASAIMAIRSYISEIKYRREADLASLIIFCTGIIFGLLIFQMGLQLHCTNQLIDAIDRATQRIIENIR